MAIAFVQPGEIWVRITAGTRLRGESVAPGFVVSVSADEYVMLAASQKAVKCEAPKPEAKPEPKPVAAVKPAKVAKSENKK